MKRVILVTGDRNWGWKYDPKLKKRVAVHEEIDFMRMVLDEMMIAPGVDLLVHGGADGLDTWAGGWARNRGVACERVPADWDQYGKSAGPIRNRKMYDDFKPLAVIAFHRDFNRSRGTKDMVTYALSKKECTVVIHPSPVGASTDDRTASKPTPAT